MSNSFSKAIKKKMVKQYKGAEKAGRKVTGTMDGEIISRPKTRGERCANCKGAGCANCK